MTAASWEALVTRARQITSAGLNDERRWQLGDVALEVAPVPTERASRALIEEAQKTLGRFAAEVGISVNVVKDARRTAAAWPRTERDFSQSYSRHKALVLLPDRFERIREPRRVPSPPGFTEGQQRAVERVFNLLRRPGVAEAVKAAARNSKTDRVGREAASETIRSENHASQEARRMKRAVERELLEAQRSKSPDVLYLKVKGKIMDMPFTLAWVQNYADMLPPPQRTTLVQRLLEVEATLKETVDKLRSGGRPAPRPASVIKVGDSAVREKRSRAEIPGAPES